MKFIFFITLFFNMDSYAQLENKIYTSEMIPYVESEKSTFITGEAVFLISELIKIIGNQKILNIPFARIPVSLKSDKNSVAFPIVRSPSRENQFQWMIPILSDDIVIVSKNKKDQNTLTQIALLRGSVIAELTPSVDLKKILTVTTNKQGFLLMDSERIDGWMTLRAIAEGHISRQKNKNNYQIQNLNARATLYLVGNLNMEKSAFLKWQNAFLQLQKNGLIKELTNKTKYKSIIYAP